MSPETQITQIRSASRELVQQLGLLNNQFSNIGSISQCHTLVELDTYGVMNLNQLSARLNLEKSSTSRLVAQLCENKICHIQPDESDRRNKLISLTKKGRDLVNEIHAEATIQVQQALDLISDEEKSAVVNGLSIYAKALKQAKLQKEYSIRILQKSDMPQLIHLTKTVWAEFGFDSAHPSASVFEEELHKTYEAYNTKKSEYFVLIHGKKIVGGAGYAPLAGEKNSICELKGMYLSSQLRGLGLGNLLLKKVLLAAVKDKYRQCYLETMAYMHGANKLYKKFGFKKLSKTIGNTGHHWTDHWYLKDLSNISPFILAANLI